MSTPARRHWQRMTAASAGKNPRAARASSDQDELMHAVLHERYRQLKQIKSVERKIELKRSEILPEFADYIAGVLEADSGAPNNVLMTLMVWRLDASDLAGGLAIADYAMRHGIDAPDRYERDTPTIIAEQVAEEVLGRLKADPDNDEAAAELLEHIEHAAALTEHADMHDQVRAKLEKAWGYALRAKGGELDDAREHLERALSLNSQIGVKKDIERLDREIKNAAKADNAEDPAAD